MQNGKDSSVIDHLEQMVATHSLLEALRFGGISYSYKELDSRVNQHANYLLSQGVKKGDIVGIVLDRSPQVIVCMLAVLKCGASYLPIDPDFPEDRVRLMLEDSEASFVWINRVYFDKLSPLPSSSIVIEDAELAIQSASVSGPGIKVSGDDVAYLLYTSGSTGKPKGVMVSHKNLLNFLLGMQDIFQPGVHTRLLSVTTISFDIAGLEIFLPLISGGCLVLADKPSTKDSKALIGLLKTERINMLQATPATYKLMLQESWSKDPSLTLLCGGEALPKHLADGLLQKCGRLYNMYGPTETTVWSTFKEIKEGDEQITIGIPIRNTSVYVLDEHHQPVPVGKEGEIFIGGDGVALGYYKRPDLTSERFIPDPYSNQEGARLYKTGDLGRYLPNGELVCLGRSDNQAKIRGYRIELEEIEHYITKLDDIKDAVVKVEGVGESDQKLIAYVIPEDIGRLGVGEVSKEELLRWRRDLSRWLPDYMIPNGWLKLKEFPLTPNKKVDRKALRYKGGEESQSASAPSRDLSELTGKIKAIWEQELDIKGIDLHDDFFELGGHSMIAIRVMTKIEKETGAKLPISALFENATIASLAEAIYADKKIDYTKVLIPIKATGNKTPIFIVHPGGLNVMLYKLLGQYLDDDQPLFGLQGLGMDGDLTHLGSIESIAKRYLKEVMEYDANGPYIVMGYSFGGVIAFEMAKQLREMGKEIKMLGILDTDVFSDDHYNSKLKLYTVKALRQFKKVAFYIKQLVTTPKTFFKYQWIALNLKFNKNYVIPDGVYNLERHVKDHNIEVHGYEEKVVAAYDKANEKYKLQPIDVEIDLFKGDAKPVYFNVDPEYLSWKKYTLRGVQRHIVPGDHFTILFPPNNIQLAKTIQNVLNNKN